MEKWIDRVWGMFLLVLLLSGCNGRSDKSESEKLVIFHAGSLSIPLYQIADAFKQDHPEVIFEFEAGGSVTCVRKVTDLGKS